MPLPCHDPAMAFRGRFQKGIFVAWQGNGMVFVNQIRPHCLNHMGNTQSKPLAERHGNGTVCVNRPLVFHLMTGPNLYQSELSTSYDIRWVHTCNVTTYRNAVTLQVTETIRSYGLNFNPVPQGVTVSCQRYTMGFSVCYGSQKHHECKAGERSGRW
jgi:hypothetical protein